MTKENMNQATEEQATEEKALTEASNHKSAAIIVKDEKTGKFKRVATYEQFASIVPETKEQQIAFFNLLNDDESALGLKDHVGVKIEIADVIFSPYESVDEETGELTNGVVTYLITPKNLAYVTSSKSVYFTLQNLFKAFGRPHWEGEDVVKVEVVEKKGREHKYIDIKVVG